MGCVIQPVGIDIGYHETKVADSNGKVRTFPSLAGPTPDGLGLADTQATDMLYRMLEPWQMLVGRYAYAQKVGSPNLSAEWFQSDEYMALAMAGLSDSTSFHQAFQLVTGLPVDHLAHKDALEERLSGMHQVVWSHVGSIQTIKIEARVVSQGIGALALFLLDEDGTPTVPVEQLRNDERVAPSAVADSGAGTTCLLACRGAHTIAQETRSLAVGAWTIERNVRRALIAQYGEPLVRKLSRHELLFRIRTNSLTRFGEPLDTSDIFEAACRAVASEIVHEMADMWGNGSHFQRMILCGGCGLLLGPYLKETYPALQLVDDPVTANSRGYVRLAKLLLK